MAENFHDLAEVQVLAGIAGIAVRNSFLCRLEILVCDLDAASLDLLEDLRPERLLRRLRILEHFVVIEDVHGLLGFLLVAIEEDIRFLCRCFRRSHTHPILSSLVCTLI